MTDAPDASLLAAAELVAAIGDQAARDRESFDAGYRDAAQRYFELGVAAGRMAAERAAAERWIPIAERIDRIADLPAYAELLKRRALPGGPVYYAAILRNDGTEFGGVGRPRVPAPVGAVQAAVAWIEREVPRGQDVAA
jgi:hypothetical protein